MKRIFFIFFLLTAFLMLQVPSVSAATTYFSCTVIETVKGNRKVSVTVKFAVKDLDVYKKKGELIQYPDTDEEGGMIFVSPRTVRGQSTTMTNLNAQGGDLRIEGDNLRLFGDGDGYQFTDLVIWDVDSGDSDDLEGYVRDYGPAYGDDESFKQFIKCKSSAKEL